MVSKNFMLLLPMAWHAIVSIPILKINYLIKSDSLRKEIMPNYAE